MADGPIDTPTSSGPSKDRPQSKSNFWPRLLNDTFVGILSGIISGVVSAAGLVAFSDDLRDLAVRLRTATAPGHVFTLYDPREPPNSGPTVTYNLYGIRESDEFEGIFGRRNPDGSTNYDVTFRYKGYARDGQMYISYAPVHAERFASGQFQSINRLENDVYFGLVIAQICDDSQNSKSIQRVMVGVLARAGQERKSDKAALALLQPIPNAPNFKPMYDLNFSSRDCVRTVSGKSIP